MHSNAPTWPLTAPIVWQRRYLLMFLVACIDSRRQLVIMLQDLADQTGFCISTVRNHLHSLERAGYIEYESMKMDVGVRELRITVREPELRG